MSAPIASLTTTVVVSRSVDQIRRLVEKFGAREFRTLYDDGGRVSAVRFAIVDPHLTKVQGQVAVFSVSLRAPTDVILAALTSGKAPASWDAVGQRRHAAKAEQAERVAWRNLHDFVRASLIGVQTGLLTVGEAFFANLVVDLPNGREMRLGDAMIEQGLLSPSHGRLLLGSGK